MRHFFLTAMLSLVCVCTGLAQYGNEWIDFTKTYYKFSVTEDGIYQIPQSALVNAGFIGIPGELFRLYRQGEEVAIYTSNEGVFSAADFIEFYGERNRGEFDRPLYQDPDADQLNPRYSMFTDSSTYFLTWASSGQGKRITNIQNDLMNPPAAETYYMHQDEWVYSERTLDPRNASEETPISLSRYQDSEGFATVNLKTFQLDIASSMIASNGPDAQLAVRLASSTFNDHNIIARFGADTLLSGGNSIGFQIYQLNKSLAAGAIQSNQLLDIVDSSLVGAFVISTIQWTYPRQYDFTGRGFARFRHQSNGSAQYFELNNFSHGNADPVIYDRSSGVRLIGIRNGNTLRFLLPANTGERDIVIASQTGAIHTIDAFIPRTFTDYADDNTEYIIITHPSLRSGSDIVAQYAQYRSSSAGGGYNVGIYNILDLYDQFGYGIGKHPQAIRNFNKMIVDRWSDARMVLIIGKGIVYTVSRAHGSEGEQHLLVPTFGHPGADHLLFTDNGVSRPPFPIGRLPVSDQSQLQAYLVKIMEHDQVTTHPQTIADKGWTKHILHMGGGADASQQAQILSFLDQMADISAQSPMGSYASTFSKTSTNTTGESNSDQIIKILREGVAVVKFFGHSSASTLDFQINNPRDWDNKGKYPIFSAMGCKAGDIHQDFLSLSENFVFEPNAGTIAFIAGSGPQYLSTLGNWGKDWYSTFGYGVNSLTLGETILGSLDSLNQFGALSAVLLVEQQTLTGDPAIRFYATPGPDYVWDYQSVNYEPEVLTTDEPSFTLTADVVNIGTCFPDTLLARVEQKYPDGSQTEIFFDTVYLNGFRTQLQFTIPIERGDEGLNTIYLTIDPLNETPELPEPVAEENNELADASGKTGIDIFILDNRAKTNYPVEFSIVTESTPELIASSTNAFIKGARFVMEMDTTPDFNSSLRLREYFSGFGGVLRWKPSFNFVPGTVYYWRVSTDSENGDYLWDSSSFLYNPGGQKGWNQSHYGQFEKDVLNSLDFDANNRLDFDTVFRNIWVQNKVDFDVETLDDDPVVYINNRLRRDFFSFYSTFAAHVSVIVIDSFSSRFLRNPPGGLYGSVNPTDENILLFPFNTATLESRNDLMTFLTDVVEDGMYAILFSYQRPDFMEYYPQDWESDEQVFGRSIFSVIEDGVPGSEIRSLAQKGSVPYLLFYRKNRALLFEGIANQLEETLSFDYNYISHASEGELISTLIGPAKKWHSFEWDFMFSENPAQDEVAAELIALSSTLMDTLRIDVTSVQDTLLDSLDVSQYPYLYLRFQVEDVPNLTAASVNYWRVLYDGVPDLLIDPAGGFDFEGDSLMIGQPMNLTTNIENLGADVTESIPVRFTITDALNNSTAHLLEVPPLLSGESTLVQISQEMQSGAGRNTLLVELNPDHTIAESTYQNNTGILNFMVFADRSNPILDVTFDGRHLVAGDIVSTHPVIVATLHDENPYRLLDDKTAFEILLEYPNDFDYTEIDINAPEISFDPATSGELNTARLSFRPQLEDGFYEMIIRAHDRSDNEAGVVEYQIDFEVLGDRLISRVDAEPRWFYDHTRFIFTISGSDLPSAINLEICDATGRIVRDIGNDEIGLFVGTTEYVWDGTSESGDRLPAGVYFYRLTAKDAQGNDYDYLGSGFETLRDARVGKVVIVR